MILESIHLNNFKNITSASLEFAPEVNCFLGNNGMGKSNLLDAIYTLSFCKSFTGAPDSMLITTDEPFLMASARYLRRDVPEELILSMKRGQRKHLKRGGKEYSRLSEHIGRFPLVMVSPADIDIIRGSGEERRRWMDQVISQSDPRYLDALMRYNRALEQRNRLLRDGAVDHLLYQALEIPMSSLAAYIMECRRRWIDELSSIFTDYYTAIAGTDEPTGLRYHSSLAEGESLLDALDSRRRHDEIVKHTSAGPHRDDIDLSLSGMPLRRTGSQGQCKSFTIALRLAQYDFLHRAVGLKPLLLLDDIFDKLDSTRVERIMRLVTDARFGQIFITDTNRKHLDEIVALTERPHRLWSVADGNFELIDL